MNPPAIDSFKYETLPFGPPEQDQARIENDTPFQPSKIACRRKKKHDAMVAQRHADRECEEKFALLGSTAMTPFDFLWEIMPDEPAYVRASFDEIKSQDKNFSVTACACLKTNAITIYQGLKADPVNAHFRCMQCL